MDRVAIAFCVLTASAGCDGITSPRSGGEPYALDDVSREVGASEEASCDRESLTRYEGDAIDWAGALQVHPAFTERLERLEAIASEVGVTVYGRAPAKIEHAGAFACRTVRGRETRLSEHALGNAVDVVGFRFPRLPDDQKGPADLPDGLRRRFYITVGAHWEARGEEDRPHERFFQKLTDRLAEDRVFRGMIGPADEGHARHLHFDMGPYEYLRL